jgi:hypothetical protein
MSGFMSARCKFAVNQRCVAAVAGMLELERIKIKIFCFLVLVGGHIQVESSMMTWK